MTPLVPVWLRDYRAEWWWGDVGAAVVVTLLLIPQSLAYAVLAGVPAGVGLVSSVVPLLIYALTGRSHAQSVGPMAVTSLMVFATVTRFATPQTHDYLLLASLLAILSGGMLVVMGLLRFGFLADLLSAPVLSAFLAASAVLIMVSQLAPLLGFAGGGATLPALLRSLWQHATGIGHEAALLGGGALIVLLVMKRHGHFLLPGAAGQMLGRLFPALVILVGMLLTRSCFPGVPHVGSVPQGFPAPAWPVAGASRIPDLLIPAFFIALVNYVQGLSVAQWLAQRRGETIDPDRELLALGLCNVGAGLFGGFPVTGGLTRSVVNEQAGAQTQLASVLTAVAMVLVLVFATPVLVWLPLPVLAATIIAAVSSMLVVDPLRLAWRSDRADAVAWLVTFALVLLLGVDTGIIAGVVVSLASWIWRSSRPHIAELGRVPGTEHFRNVLRYDVECLKDTLLLRIDESLYFGNQRMVRNRVQAAVEAAPALRNVVLVMSGVNRVDVSALTMLGELDRTLAGKGLTLYLAEVKGPVGDVLDRGGLAQGFAGRIFLSAQAAWLSLSTPADFQI